VTKMSEKCRWLHEALETLPVIQYPFDVENLPQNGIYFFYEQGEAWGHGTDGLRIVRIGTSRQGNFGQRISEHLLLDERKMDFDRNRLKPSDRSIFRKNIGRALLNRDDDPYREIWEIDFTPRVNRERSSHLRDIDKEREIETEITELLRANFAFRFVVIGDAEIRRKLERCLIATVARCGLCKPSPNWLGQYSPKDKIRSSGLWQVRYLRHHEIGKEDTEAVRVAILRTKDWLANSPLW